ncbi:hypothetical protein FZW96_12135 [Bacillus sp. BGMRC 2118]|nr:hypothetical protein FZW96_12135 [Bacillus sp. BGMRC 2118]
MIPLIAFGSLGATLIGMTFAERMGWISVNEEAVKWSLIILFILSFLLWFGLENPIWNWIW